MSNSIAIQNWFKLHNMVKCRQMHALVSRDYCINKRQNVTTMTYKLYCSKCTLHEEVCDNQR